MPLVWPILLWFAAPAPACHLRAMEIVPWPLPPVFEAMASQLRPGLRGPLVEPRSSQGRYAGHDPVDPWKRLVPPRPMVTILHVTPSFLIGGATTGLVVAHRSSGAATRLPATRKLMVVDALERRDGSVWILAAGPAVLGRPVPIPLHPGPLVALRRDRPDARWALSNGKGRVWHSGRLATAGVGQAVAAAWVTRPSPGRLSLRLRWLDQPGDDVEIDHVEVPPSYADLLRITGENLVMAAHGEGELAIAWRPLLPPTGPPADTGDREHPSTAAFPAEVRVLLVAPGAGPRLVSRHPTRLLPLGFVSGIGPWPLQGGGAWAVTLDGRATFLWVDPASRAQAALVGAQPGDPAPTVLVADGARTLWTPAEASAARSLVVRAYRPGDRQVRSFNLTCAR